MLPVETPFKIYTGLDGKPLDNGFVYFGLPNQDPIAHPITVYWDAAGALPAAQPLRTVSGYIMNAGTPANVFVDGAYSELVNDSKARQVFYSATSDDFSVTKMISNFLNSLSQSVGSSLLGFIQAGIGAVVRPVQDELRDVFKITQFGASIASSVATNKAALQKAITAADTAGGGVVVVPGGINYGYKRTDFTTFPDFTGCVTPITVIDQGVGNSYTGASRDGAQVRYISYTPNPAFSDGGGLLQRSNWHPYIMLSSDNYGTRDTSDPYRASLFFEANGASNGWRLGQRDTAPGFPGTTIEQQTGFGLSVEGNYIWNAATSTWNSTGATFIQGHSRYKGYWAWGGSPEGLGRAYGFYIRKDVDNAIFAVKGETPSQAPTLLMEAAGTANSIQIAMTQTGLTRAVISVAGSVALSVDNENHIHIGSAVPATTYHSINSAVAEGAKILQVNSSLTTATAEIYAVSAFNANAAAAAVKLGRDSTTSRSLATGGTLNASGADYAEYMRKAAGCGELAKGAIAGINASGELTDKWVDAVAFCVKSTDPSYVGGDTWGSSLGARPDAPTYREPDYIGAAAGEQPTAPLAPETDSEEVNAKYEADLAACELATAEWNVKAAEEAADRAQYAQQVAQAEQGHAEAMAQWRSAVAQYDAQLEALRQQVDRIAFAGQVPVNVQSATPGQLIVPVQDGTGISGIVKNEADITLAEYMRAVGKVIAIEADGRARIIVKVA